MSTPLRTRLRRRLASFLAVAASAGLLLVGLPATAQAAPGDYAKITTGKRCDQMHLKKTLPRTPNNSGAPTGLHHWVKSGPDEEFYYNNDFKGFENVPVPSQADLKAAGSTRADIDGWDAKYAASRNPEDMKNAIYARYHRHRIDSTNPKPFGSWMTRYLINNQANGQKGGAFEVKAVQDFNLVGPDWLCEVTIEIYDKNGNKIASRRYDAYNQRTGELGEFKSNGHRKPAQYRADKIILRHKDARYDFTRARLTMFTSEKTTNVTLKDYGSLNRALRAERGTGNNPIRIAERRATAKGLWPQTKYTKTYPDFSPSPNTRTQGPLNSLARESGRNAAEAKQIQAEHNKVNTRSALGRGPGGVDFSTLELQYVGNPVKGKGLDYSMKADFVADPDSNPGWGGEAKLTLASDALFTWLALTPDKFWVNLNPDEPERIMDKEFAKTDAGRVLLEADLRLKHDAFVVMDPGTRRGKQFWDSLARRDGAPCLHGMRSWIEPEPAKVREQDGGIYILDAPLKVSSVPQETNTPGPGKGCDLTKAEIQHNQRMYDTLIEPEVIKKINGDPVYADLRRVYSSRVAAEWIRQQDAKKATDFRPIINSDDVRRWPLRGENKDWKKETVYKKYVKVFKEGEFEWEMEYGGLTYTYIVGGVDFSKAPKRNISQVEFRTQHRSLPHTTKDSVRAQTSARDAEVSYLGGNGAARTDDGKPTPTPTPTPKPTPTPDPTDSGKPTPAPTPTGGETPPAAEDPDGDLADTGSDTPIGLIAAIAATLAAAGGVLMWWMRRRRTTDDQDG
ncbi:hypothetical protein ABZO31_33565 [Streptomyces sp. HUAS MG47]|uniref:hypothetical protein n=1 Tax=Streptomyces solicamelliae TaxID=3231716 RepID=UPI003877F4E3